MSSRALAARLAAVIAAAASPACFSDGGLHSVTAATTDTSTTTDATTSTGAATITTGTTTGATTGAATSTTAVLTTGAAPGCGDGVVDPMTEQCDDGNQDDGDACLAGCVAASCGDGLVWSGVEECDDGAANHPTLPGVCRPTCKNPACGDGGIYVGPAKAPIVLAGGQALIASDDAPRTLGVAADGSFVVAWADEGSPLDRIFAQRLGPDGALVGAAVELQPEFLFTLRDVVLAVGPSGDYALAWENLGDPDRVRLRGVQADTPADPFYVTPNAGAQDAPAIALGPGGELVAAYLRNSHIRVRRFPSFVVGDAPAELQVSELQAGSATSPTVAIHGDGAFVVAWGDPGGAILYRRYSPAAEPGPIVSTDLRTGGGPLTSSKPWSAMTIRPQDGAVVVVGLDGDGLLRLTRFDQTDAASGAVVVADTPARFVPTVDVASDAVGNLAVAWSACGVPGDAGTNCSNLPSTSAVRWFYADLTPFAPATVVTMANQGQPAPMSLAVAPSGVTAVSHASGANVLVHLFPLQCPP